MKSIGKFVKGLSTFWTVVVFVFAIALLLMRFAVLPFGYEPIWCMSNSMAPEFHEGALCYIDKNYDTNAIEKGDIIAYQLSNGAMVTHRVYDVTDEGVITKGDANKSVDFAPVAKEQIIGENVLQIEYLGNLFKDFPNMLLISIIAFAIAVMIFLDLLSGILLGEGDKKNAEGKKEINMDDSNSNNSN